MEWFKRKVVMLQSEQKAEKGDLVFFGDKLIVAKSIIHLTKPAQNLYFLSDEEIKEGFSGWAIVTVKDDTRIKYLVNVIVTEKNQCYCKEDRKFSFQYYQVNPIIAATDKSLFTHQKETASLPERIFYLPEPSKDFLEIYANAYNQGKQIDEVLIGYDEVYIDPIGNMSNVKLGDDRAEHQPHVKADNTISIRKAVEKTYSRFETICLLEKIAKECYSYPENFGTGICFDQNKLNEWIKENL